MFVGCEYCILSGRGICDELITRPEKYNRLRCVVVCDLETSTIARIVQQRHRKKKKSNTVNTFTGTAYEKAVIVMIAPKPHLFHYFFKGVSFMIYAVSSYPPPLQESDHIVNTSTAR